MSDVNYDVLSNVAMLVSTILNRYLLHEWDGDIEDLANEVVRALEDADALAGRTA